MACPAIITGDAFLSRVLAHIDCQAQTLGSFGYQALSAPGSPASLAITGLLTLFIALFGIRLLFGPAPVGRDVVSDVLKVGIVLTLAFSWPAFRVLAYDLVLTGPAEVAASISPSTLPQTGTGFSARLQGVDNAIVDLTRTGSGRQTGGLLEQDSAAGGFQGVALEDESSFGWARLVWLSGVIGTLASLRLVAGLLLALAPLAAGLLLFEATRGLFTGWLRGLVLAMIGSLGATIVLAAELAIIEPWLTDALRLRGLGYATPSAPTELLAITLGFAIAGFGMLFVLAKVAFTRGWLPSSITRIETPESLRLPSTNPVALAGAASDISTSGSGRAQRIANSVELSMRRDETVTSRRIGTMQGSATASAQTENNRRAPNSDNSPQRLGSSWRRTSGRSSGAASRRETRS